MSLMFVLNICYAWWTLSGFTRWKSLVWHRPSLKWVNTVWLCSVQEFCVACTESKDWSLLVLLLGQVCGAATRLGLRQHTGRAHWMLTTVQLGRHLRAHRRVISHILWLEFSRWKPWGTPISFPISLAVHRLVLLTTCNPFNPWNVCHLYILLIVTFFFAGQHCGGVSLGSQSKDQPSRWKAWLLSRLHGRCSSVFFRGVTVTEHN